MLLNVFSLFSTSWEYGASRSSSSKRLLSGLGKDPLSDNGIYEPQNPGTIDKRQKIRF